MHANTIQKYQKRTPAFLIKKATEVFNEYIRLRDQDAAQRVFFCISCGLPKPLEQLQAGHYMSAGHHAAVRFDEDNVHGQCIRCNMHLSGNQANYRNALIRKLGLEKVEFIEMRAKMVSKWDRYSLIEIIETYSEKVKELKANNNLKLKI
ncbi:MAG: recombination protein NinG [Taibaiella sp.]|jgi:hypothetical protein